MAFFTSRNLKKSLMAIFANPILKEIVPKYYTSVHTSLRNHKGNKKPKISLVIIISYFNVCYLPCWSLKTFTQNVNFYEYDVVNNGAAAETSSSSFFTLPTIKAS